MKKKTLCGIATILSTAVIAASSNSAFAVDVSVNAEGAYTDSDLVIYIYADITGDPLVSAGVSLSYDNTKLSFHSATKNEGIWYFGQNGGTTYDYQGPTDRGSDVLFLTGKIDENLPLQGVSGSRILIGTVTFNRLESGSPGTSPEDYFGSSMDLGIVRTPPAEFANFVTTGKVVLDSSEVLFNNVTIYKLGDADMNGSVDPMDMLYIKDTLMPASLYKCFADGDRNGTIDPMDIIWIKDNM